MQVCQSKAQLKDFKQELTGQSIGFVPTMGALHEGHLSLIREARKKNDFVIVSIFVNPLQFSPSEDLSKYPRPLDKDLDLCKKENVDLVFTPIPEEIYPEGLDKITKVIPRKSISECLCGISRPGHFDGVLTVVLKLFNLVQPHKAYFGLKDYQQFLLIKRMVEDFNLNIEIIGMPIIRELSGLALSSRNQYLTENEKQIAANLFQSLKEGHELINSGKSIGESLLFIREKYLSKFGLDKLEIDYLEARNADTLEIYNAYNADIPFKLFVATKLGNTRLIDNV